ncbi:hypothetical cytosolic protein [Syntrophus aciditrophicus SB]|uniref:Hypothetical cytosolic protein n=2 Tax=Syntrophus TaxID=43773 RepID=Q2LSH7_SYNAS|nr:hypothetical cytosolic protein [Syntrophus aciditrophicus SB]
MTAFLLRISKKEENMADRSKLIVNGMKKAKGRYGRVKFEQINSNQYDGLFECLCRRYAKGKNLFTEAETSIYAEITREFNE